MKKSSRHALIHTDSNRVKDLIDERNKERERERAGD